MTLPPFCSAAAANQKQPFSHHPATLFNLFSRLPTSEYRKCAVRVEGRCRRAVDRHVGRGETIPTFNFHWHLACYGWRFEFNLGYRFSFKKTVITKRLCLNSYV
jgi:hypothetical protein